MQDRPVAARSLRILYLSSLPARGSTSGAVVIQRHFALLGPGFEIHHAHDVPAPDPPPRYHELPRRRWFARACNTRLFPWLHELNQGLLLGVADATVAGLADEIRPDLVLTVAEGALHIAARRLALRRALPLVTIFHDWPPGWLRTSALTRRLAARQLCCLYRSSTANLCVSQELRDFLGAGHPGTRVLYPMPDPSQSRAPAAEEADGFHVVYAGVMHEIYREEMQALVQAALAAHLSDRFRFYGPPPGWETQGIHRGFVSREELDRALARASVLLVVSPFVDRWRFITRFSFPSKIPEYCRAGKPILLWAPPESAATAWARRTGAARVVHDPSPDAVLHAVRALAADPAGRRRLAGLAARCAAGEFNPQRIHAEFERALQSAATTAHR